MRGGRAGRTAALFHDCSSFRPARARRPQDESPSRRSRTRSRQPVMVAPVAVMARSAAVNLSLTLVTMSSICSRLWRTSGSARLASSRATSRMASMVRRLRVRLMRMKQRKRLRRRKPIPTSRTPHCQSVVYHLPGCRQIPRAWSEPDYSVDTHVLP